MQLSTFNLHFNKIESNMKICTLTGEELVTSVTNGASANGFANTFLICTCVCFGVEGVGQFLKRLC